jgi:hypothetical protein
MLLNAFMLYRVRMGKVARGSIPPDVKSRGKEECQITLTS